MSQLDLLILVGFCLLNLFVGLRNKSATESAYLVADRKTGYAALTATLVMTEFNTSTLLSFAGLGFVAGYWALTLPAIFLIGLLFYGITVAKKWKGFDGLSVADFFRERYGRDIGLLAGVILLVSMSGFTATYIKSLTLLVSPFFPGVSKWSLSASLVAIPLLMTLRGGLVSVIRTDIVGFIATLLFFPLLAYFAYAAIGEVPQQSIQEGMTAVPLWFISSLVVLTMFTYILAPWYGQKIFAAKSQRIAFISVISAALIVFVLYGLAVFATALCRSAVSLASPEMALPYIISQVLPDGVRGLGYAILIAASATTLTGVWSAMTTMVIGDFCKKEVQNANRAVVITLLFAGVSYLLCNLFVDQIFQKLILANIPVAALSFALLAGFYWQRASRVGAYCSIITGLIVGVFSYWYWGEEGGYTWYWAMFGIPLIFFTGVVGSLLKPAGEAHARSTAA